jgi:hypothetical protein
VKGEVGSPVTVVALPPAGPALRVRVEEVVTSRIGQRIDRPLLPETTAVRTVGVRHMRTGWSCGHADVRGDRTPCTGVRPPTVRRPPARTRSSPCGSRRGHGNERGAQPDTRPEPLLPQATATPGAHGRCPASMTTPAAPLGTGADLPPDTAGHFRWTVRHAIQVPDTRGHAAASAISRWVRWLRELVAGLSAAGGMQPAPVSASKPGGQAAAELGADVGHRRAGERAGPPRS